MKKLAALTAALILLLTAACAQGASTPDLYDIYDRTGGGMKWTGNAVPFMEGVAFASPSVVPDDSTELVIWDGKAYRDVSLGLLTAGKTVLVVLFETDGDSPGIPEYTLVDADSTLKAENMLVRSGDWMQSRINRAVLDAAALAWQELDCFLLTLSGDTEIGAPLITAEGKLAGIVIAEYAEGEHRYIALSAQGLSDCVMEAAAMLSMPEEGTGPEGYTVTVTEGNLVSFDWSQAVLPQAGEGETLYHVVQDVNNDYLTYVPVTPEYDGTAMILTPGRTYASGIGLFKGMPDRVPENAVMTVMAPAEPMTDYGFKSNVFTVAELRERGQMPKPVTEVTEELLRSGKACILSSSTYTYPGDKEEQRTLLITLEMPNGNSYSYPSNWLFMPNLQGADEWYVTLEESGLTSMMEETGYYPMGNYTVTMYIGGQLADSFTFTLTK